MKGLNAGGGAAAEAGVGATSLALFVHLTVSLSGSSIAY